MYLKSVDIYGFKSFAHKMIFKFDEGITAIVGPNGSGKSNIADAVRWVLGEQSAKMLRGSKMQDVIFAGTESRKPLGYCQVDLTIDNADKKMPIDYTEVTVSRRVYRSGEGEYYINGVECRLKDVQELFMDTGVGKEGYSIIGQGQIDLILSSKPDDRRALFDEAAGIVKFKRRKETAEKNLDEERQNLIRINDIVRELEGQKVLLEGQAETAKKYLKFKEELKKYEVNIFVYETDKLYKSIKELDEKEAVLQNQIEELRLETQQIKTQCSELDDQIEKMDLEINTQKGMETRIAVEKEKKESQIGLIREQISNLLTNSDRVAKQYDEFLQKEQELLEERKRYLSEMEKYTSQCSTHETNLLQEQEVFEKLQGSIKEHESQIDTIQTDMIERLNEISNVKTKIQRYQTMLEHSQQRKESLSSRKESIENSLGEIKRHVATLLTELDQKNVKQEQYKTQKKTLEKEVLEGEIHKKRLETIAKEKNEQLHASRSKFKALNDLSEHYEGYSFSIKKIMELKKQNANAFPGIHGVVADIIQVEKLYETAIEIALSGTVQNIVTDNEETAKKAIQYLKDNKYGRATFLPLTTIQSKENKQNLGKNDPGFIGYASELVSYDPKYKNVVDFLLSRVVVVDDLDHATVLNKKYQYSLRIVTLAGELLSPGGSMTGGAYKNPTNQFLSRKRELEELEKTIEVHQKELQHAEADHDKLVAEIKKNKETLEQTQKEEYGLNLEINGLVIRLKQLENEQAKSEEELKDMSTESTSITRQESELFTAMKELEDSLQGSQSENTHAEDTVKQLGEAISTKKVERDAMNEALTHLRIEAASSRQNLQMTHDHLSRIDREIRDIKQKMSSGNQEMVTNKELVEQKNQSIELLETEMREIEEQLMKAYEQTSALQDEKQKLTTKLHDLYAKREAQSESINLLDKDIIRLQSNKMKFEMQKETSESYMWNEYELTFHNALVFKDETLGSVTNIRKMIGDIKESIKSLGDVNVNAIEDFRTVSERYTFLTEQKEDLINAEAKLIEVIKELDEQMVRQFREKFKEITLKFNEVFQELFGGGKAILELTEDENILEAGIDIVAQPPGKKLVNMRLMSGGEKAFTAIALLFAIQSLKPSPFCVLDEIEAALDDANVTRFANYLHKLTHNTQFIIITHRRGTMEVADSLYGITMQEKGVSTQVSVKLLESDIR